MRAPAIRRRFLAVIFAGAFLSLLAPCMAQLENYRVVLYNQHNGSNNDRGTLSCDIVARDGSNVVWKIKGVRMPWRPNQDLKSTVIVPPQESKIDAFRVSITKYQGNGGGFAEIQIFRDDRDITKECKVAVSGIYDERFTPDKLVDGVTTSKVNYTGYWLLPEKSLGFVDIALPKK